MKCLLLPKNGKPRFSSKNPFEYATANGLKIIDDWLGCKWDLLEEDLPPLYAIDVDGIPELKVSLLFFSKNGDRSWEADVNKNAMIFCKAYCNYLPPIMEDLVVIVKDYSLEDNSFSTLADKDVRILRRCLKDAIRWFS